MAKVNFSHAALDDLKAIYDYIANDSEFYAEKVINKIVERTIILESHIRIGKVVAEFENTTIRELIEVNYRIIYKIESESEISVVRIYHGSRLLKDL